MHRCSAKPTRGFTLLEMMVALAVFAVLGVLASQILIQMIDLTDTATERSHRLVDLQRALDIVQRDVEQLTHRGVRDEFGDPKANVLIGAPSLIEFTRIGWRNPMQEPRPEVQRVAYALRGGSLYRAYWPVLDRTQDTEPRVQLVLDAVNDAYFIAHDDKGTTHDYWPLITFDESEQAWLNGLEFVVEIERYGTLSRLFAVPVDPAALNTDEEEGEGEGEGEGGENPPSPDPTAPIVD